MQHCWVGANPAVSADLGNTYTMGTTFCPLLDVTIYGMRLFVLDNGTFISVGHPRTMTLWRCDTTFAIAQKNLPNEIGTGALAANYGTWVNFLFDSPVSLTGRAYVDRNSCFVLSFDISPTGSGTSHYGVVTGGLQSAPVTTPDGVMFLPQDNVPSTGANPHNGAFNIGVGPVFPNQSFNGGFYGIDILYDVAGSIPTTTGGSVSGRGTLSAGVTGGLTGTTGGRISGGAALAGTATGGVAPVIEAGFTIPNLAAAPTARDYSQAQMDTLDLRVLTDADSGTGIVSGLAINVAGGLGVVVGSGSYSVAGGLVNYAGGSVTLGAASALPRRDLLVIRGGTLTSITGSPAAAATATNSGPKLPSRMPGDLVVCTVYVDAGQTTLSSADVTDKRVFVKTPAAGGGPGPVTAVYKVTDYGAVAGPSGNPVLNAAAIRSCINAAVAAEQASGRNYAVIDFDASYFRVGGSLQQGNPNWGNALIPLPVIAEAATKFILVLRGSLDQTALYHWHQASSQAAGAVLETTVIGTHDNSFGDASVIGGPTSEQGFNHNSTFSNMLVVVDGLSILVPNDPHICGFDFRCVGEAKVISGSCLVSINTSPVTGITTPTQTWQFGLAMPLAGNNDNCDVLAWSAEGQYCGALVSEHQMMTSIRCINCYVGMRFEAGGVMSHSALVGYASIEACVDAIRVTGTFRFNADVMQLDCEDGGSFGSGFIISDPSNLLYGTVNVRGVSGFTLGRFNGSLHTKVIDGDRSPGPVSPQPTMPSSGTLYTNPYFRDAAISIAGGSVTAINIDGVATGLTSGTVNLPAGEHTIAINYTGSPTWMWVLL